jgi:hypothetical protein
LGPESNGHAECKSSWLISDDFHRLHAVSRPLNLKAASQVMEQIRCRSKKKQPKAEQSDPFSPRYYIGQHSEVLRNRYEEDKVHLENVALGPTRMAGFLPGGVRCFPIDWHNCLASSF